LEICLDSNEYLFTFGIERHAECVELLTYLSGTPAKWKLRVPRLVVDEVGRNLPTPLLKECHRFWRDTGCVVDEEDITPIGLINAYRKRGLKSGDAVIAAYCEHVNAKCLVSENRDFLALAKPLPFRVMKASAFLKVFGR